MPADIPYRRTKIYVHKNILKEKYEQRANLHMWLNHWNAECSKLDNYQKKTPKNYPNYSTNLVHSRTSLVEHLM